MNSQINLYGLYNKFEGDISIETNLLSNLSNENIVEVLNYNWSLSNAKSVIFNKNIKVRLVYHKILNWSGGRERGNDKHEGFYEIKYNSKRKYYTSFSKISKFLLDKKLNPKFEVDEK